MTRRVCFNTQSGGIPLSGRDSGLIMSADYDVCVVEDDAGDRDEVVDALTRIGYRCVTAPTVRSAWEVISQHKPKVVVSAWNMPDDNAVALCHRVRESAEGQTTFFLVATRDGDVEQRTRALEAGIDDYLIKPIDSAVLLARVRVGIRMWDVTERLRQAAITDGLTGLYNHDHLNRIIEREVKRSRRYGGRLSLIMIDLDFFKAVNDTYGHLVGNDTLVEVANILRKSVRDIDTVGRYGGEEFVIVAPEASLEDAVAISDRVRHNISDTLHLEALQQHRITASFGVASADDIRVRCAADLVDLADRALYCAKSAGRNQVVTALEIDDATPLGIEGNEVEALRKQVAVLSVQAKEVYVQTVSSLLQALEEKDPFTAKHSINVSFYAENIARAIGLNEPLTVSIRNAGLLHDIGKVGIPDRILMKPTRLTPIEEMVMRQVPAISVRIIDYLRILESEMHIIRHQGEYFDGTGYPDGLKGEQIPIGSRVLLVANAFDAMTTDRVYRTCRGTEEAFAEIQANAGRQFDPKAINGLETILRTHRGEIAERIKDTVQALRISCATL